MRDLRFALRQLRRNPGFTSAAVLILALGIGINSAVFSVVNATLFRPLPVASPEDLVALYRSTPQDFMATSALTTQALGAVLYGVSPLDPATFATLSALVALVALAACLLPARQAASGDPLRALRDE